MAIAPPSRFSYKKLARLFEHELLHVQGKEHEEMTERDLWSKGQDPDWALGTKVRYRKKGASVMP